MKIVSKTKMLYLLFLIYLEILIFDLRVKTDTVVLLGYGLHL